MGDLVDELLKRHVTPVLREAGFKRSGANYRLTADNGDVAIFNARRWTTDPAVDGFMLALAVAPLPYVEWLNRDRPERMARPRGLEHGMLTWYLKAPLRWQLTPKGQDTVWALAHESEVDAVGEELRKILTDGVPWLVSLFDHDRLCATIQERYADFDIRLERHLGQAVIRSAEGPAEEVTRLLAASEEVTRLIPAAHAPALPALREWIIARLPQAS
jgi:hypothetical protein